MDNYINQKPENYLVWAILSTVMCCMPLGIVSIVKSTQVDSLWAAGDQVGALKASEDAKKWAIFSAIAAVVCGLLYVVCMAIYFVVIYFITEM